MVLRTAIVYLFVVAALRLSGKRQVGENTTLWGGLVAVVTLLALDFALKALARRSKPLRTAIEAEPRLLVRDGKLLVRAIEEEGLEVEEVRAAIRSHGLVRVEDVRIAVLETDGSISVIPRDDDGVTSNRPAADERQTLMRGVAAVVLATTIVIGGCNPLPVRTVSIGGEPWTVYMGGGDGMRGLPGFGDADGMLFDMGREVDPSAVAFGMEGVGYPIDIAWFDADGMVVSVASMAACDAAPCRLYHAAGPYRWAVEAPVGAFGDLAPPDRLVVED